MADNKTIEFDFAEFKKELLAMVNETLVERLSEATMERAECNGKLKTIFISRIFEFNFI